MSRCSTIPNRLTRLCLPKTTFCLAGMLRILYNIDRIRSAFVVGMVDFSLVKEYMAFLREIRAGFVVYMVKLKNIRRIIGKLRRY